MEAKEWSRTGIGDGGFYGGLAHSELKAGDGSNCRVDSGIELKLGGERNNTFDKSGGNARKYGDQKRFAPNVQVYDPLEINGLVYDPWLTANATYDNTLVNGQVNEIGIAPYDPFAHHNKDQRLRNEQKTGRTGVNDDTTNADADEYKVDLDRIMVYNLFAIIGNVDSSSDTDSEHGGYTAGEEWSHTDQSEWDERGDAMFWWDSYFTYNAHEVNNAVVLDADNDSTCTNDTEKG